MSRMVVKKAPDGGDGQSLIPFTEAQEADPHTRKPRRGFVTTIKLKVSNRRSY